MMKTLVKQSGMTFGGFIMIAIVFVVVAIFTLKLIPSYMENAKIQNALVAVVKDPAMQNAALFEIKDAFRKRAITMDNVTAVSENDLVISKENGRLEMSATYSVKIPLFGNVSLVIDFTPHAPQ
jgi:hypothetical protein